MHVEKTNKHLPGVKCVVNTCHYYSEGDYCNAKNIQIQPKNARDIQETYYDNYKNKNMQG